MNFKDYLLEMPMGIDDFETSPVNNSRHIKDKIKEFNKLRLTKIKTLFDDYEYAVANDTIFVHLDGELVLYISLGDTPNKTIFIDVIENLSNIRGLAAKVYRALLNKPQYDEIITGTELTKSNIKSHLKMIPKFDMFLRNKTGDISITTTAQFNKIMKRSNSNDLFVLK